MKILGRTVTVTDSHLRKISIASAALSLLTLGIVLGAFAPPLRKTADKTVSTIADLRRSGLAYLGVKPSGHLAPLRAEVFNRVTLVSARSAPGVTLVTGLFGDKMGSRLYDSTGAIIFEWPQDLFDLFPKKKKYRFDALAHGDFLYPNGDLVVNIDHVGMARLGACGEIRWAHANQTHHSIDIDDEGFIWAPLEKRRYRDKRFDGRPFSMDRIGKFDPATGDLVEEISIEDALADEEMSGVVRAGQFRRDDVLHLNDVEILGAADAPAFPHFAVGDILISGRNQNVVMVLDGKLHVPKWWRVGPMHGQHDPDFQPNGEITIFDNQTAGEAMASNGYRGGSIGSRIIAINPSEFDFRDLYASNELNAFYSDYRGKHQLLANGDILITESAAGRAFEATPDGRIAWMIVNKYDDKHVGWLTSATRYPESYASIGKNCPKTP